MGSILGVNPAVMQLVIVPIVVIALGVTASVLAKKIYVGPLVTLLLHALYEVWYNLYYYPGSGINFTTWNLLFPIYTLIISAAIIKDLQRKKSEEKQEL